MAINQGRMEKRMVLFNVGGLILAMVVLIESSRYCIKYASRVARTFHMSEFMISFFVVSVISVFPETMVGIMSTLDGVPSFGLGALLGSNVTDLTLVFGLVAVLSLNGVAVRSSILKRDFIYLVMLVFPVVLGFDGHYSRFDGLLLITIGLLFYVTLSIESKMFHHELGKVKGEIVWRDVVLMLLSLGMLLLGAQYTVHFGTSLAYALHVPSVIISLTLISIGTCLPELIFSIRAVRSRHDGLALGDILGTVITDATIVLGVIVLIRPFSFDVSLIYLTGMMMFFAGVIAVIFISTGKQLSKAEGVWMILFYLLFLVLVVSFQM